MKLHLPKLLSTAILLSTLSTATAAVITQTAPDADGSIKYHVGEAGLEPATMYTAESGNADFIMQNHDTLGIYKENGTLITHDFGKSYEGAISGPAYTNELCIGSGSSTSLKANLIMSGYAKIALGGQYRSVPSSTGSVSTDKYIGITAKDVTMSENAELIAGKANFSSLTVSGNASVSLHGKNSVTENSGATEYTGGNTLNVNKYFTNLSSSDKVSTISGKLEISDSAQVTIGVDNGQYGTGEKYKTNHWLNQLGGTIVQNSNTKTDDTPLSNLAIKGKTFFSGAMNITQNGGNMEIGLKESDDRKAIVYLKSTTNNKITQTGNGTIKIGKMINGTSTVSASQLIVNQSGTGIIDLENGVEYTSNTASTITQSGGGIINLSGDFSRAVFDIEQSKGSINLKSGAKMASNILSLNTAATLNIAGTMTVNDKLSFNLTTPGQETAAIVMASGGNIEIAKITSAVEFNLEEAIISDMKMEALAYTAETGEAEYTYTIDLISGLSVADKAEFDTLIENGKLSWSLELPQALSESTITSTELLESGIQWSDSGDTLQLYTTWKSVPEPATATLSLLALATLAARRRRK